MYWVWTVSVDEGVCSCVFGGPKIVFHFFNYKILYTQQLHCACAVLILSFYQNFLQRVLSLCIGISAVECEQTAQV